MKNYYRVTCEEIGIYEYIKRVLKTNQDNSLLPWDGFLADDCNAWLKKPMIYLDKENKYRSYFNALGYQIFLEKTYPVIIKIIDEKLIKVEIVKIEDKNILYQDEYQIVVSDNQLEKAREFCFKVKQLAKEYHLSFFVVTEGASAISNNHCEAVKHARDCHIAWEKQHGFDPDEDWMAKDINQ